MKYVIDCTHMYIIIHGANVENKNQLCGVLWNTP